MYKKAYFYNSIRYKNQQAPQVKKNPLNIYHNTNKLTANDTDNDDDVDDDEPCIHAEKRLSNYTRRHP